MSLQKDKPVKAGMKDFSNDFVDEYVRQCEEIGEPERADVFLKSIYNFNKEKKKVRSEIHRTVVEEGMSPFDQNDMLHKQYEEAITTMQQEVVKKQKEWKNIARSRELINNE